MTKRFEKAYNALVKAYFEGTLFKGSCYACAVGNIVADAQNGVLTKHVGTSPYNGSGGCTTNNTYWKNLFLTYEGEQKLYPRLTSIPILIDELEHSKAKLLEETGYTWEEMAQVEFAFETNSTMNWWTYSCHTEQEVLEDQFKGLSAVVDVLVKLDNIENTDNKYNQKFREHPKLVNMP